jgi:uncharacterized protein DUF5753
MRCQLDRLIDATCQPNITLQVLPYAADAHPAMCGLFYLFRFPGPDLPDIVYGEHLTSAFYLDKPAEVASCIEALDRLSAQAAPPARPQPSSATSLRRLMSVEVAPCWRRA